MLSPHIVAALAAARHEQFVAEAAEYRLRTVARPARRRWVRPRWTVVATRPVPNRGAVV